MYQYKEKLFTEVKFEQNKQSINSLYHTTKYDSNQ